MNSRYPKFWFFWFLSTALIFPAGVIALICIFGWIPVTVVGGIWIVSAAIMAQRESNTPVTKSESKQQFSEAAAIHQ